MERYRRSILLFNEADWMSQATLVLLNSAQNLLVTLGMMGGMLLCAHRVVEGSLTVGDFSLFMSYVMQLYAPLNWLGTHYRVIQVRARQTLAEACL